MNPIGGLREQCSPTGCCYYCGRVVYSAVPLSTEKTHAIHHDQLTCGDCANQGLPTWRPARLQYQRWRYHIKQAWLKKTGGQGRAR